MISYLVLLIASTIQPIIAYAEETIPTTASPRSSCYDYGPYHMWGSSHNYGWICALIFMVLLFVVIAKLVFYGRCCGHHHHHGPCHRMGQSYGNTCREYDDPNKSALRILNERLAKGEIQQEEFEAKRTAIISNQQ